MLALLCVIFLLAAIVTWILMLYDCIRLNSVGPWPLPLLGNTLILQGDSEHFLTTLCDLCNKYGNAVRMHLFLSKYIILGHTKYIEAVVSSTVYIDKGRSYELIKPWLGNGLLTASGRRWKLHRKFLTPAFHFNIVQNFLPIFNQNEHILIEKIQSMADGKPFNLFPIIALSVLDNVAESIMGVAINAQKDSDSNYVKAVETMSRIISGRMRNPFVWSDFIFGLVYGRQQNQSLKVLRSVCDTVIKSRQEELIRNNITSLPTESEMGIKNKYAFLDLLLLSEIDGKKIDLEAVREEVETFMFEGHDTTTAGIVFCLYCISNHKEVEDKLQDEQRKIFGDDLKRPVTYNDLQSMQYLELVIKESMRLYPPVPIFERWILKDTELAGLKVLKNTRVVLNIFQMQRNPDIYEDPLEFRPERQLQAMKPYNWMAFSAGPRNCIGQKFAMMELKQTLSSILRNFKLVPSNIEPKLCADLILRSKNGVQVGFLPKK